MSKPVAASTGAKIVLRKINNITVKPMAHSQTTDNRPIMGADLVPEIYSNVFLCARKKSGKTVVIQKILQACAGPNTTIVAFCPTIGKDPGWLAIQRWAKKKGINFQGFHDIFEGKFDILDSFVKKLEEEEEQELPYSDEDSETEYEDERSRYMVEVPQKGGLKFFGKQPKSSDKYEDEYSHSESEDEQEALDMFDGRAPGKDEERLFHSRPKTSIKKKEKFRAAEFIFVFDDMSHNLKKPSVCSLMKKNRHFRSLCLFSSQYVLDLKPEQTKQLDLLILFKGLDDEKLQKTLTACDLPIDFITLKTVYDDAVKEQYSFLWVNTRDGEFRKQFDKKYEIHSG